MFAKVDEKLGRRLPVNTIFLAPTIRRMADMMREDPSAQHSLVLLRKGSLKPPLFCINNAVTGTLIEFGWIIEELTGDWEVYGLQMSCQGTVQTGIEDMASNFIKNIKHVQTEGPYYLLGHCAGGALAYEIARQLKDLGEEVGFLGIIDLIAPKYVYRLDLRSLKLLAGRIRVVLSNIANAPPGQRIKRVLSLPDAALQFIYNLLQHNQANNRNLRATENLPFPDWIVTIPEPYQQAAMTNYPAYRKYNIKPYRGNLTFFVSRKTRDGFKDAIYHSPSLGWEKFVEGSVRTYCIPGDHTTIAIPPNVKELTKAIEECMVEARGNTR
jgi:thioesterase domain-containing protein